MCSLVASFQVIKRTPSCQPVNSWYNQTRLFTCSPIPPARPPLYWDDYAASTLSDKLSTQGGERAFYVSTHSFHKDKDCQAPGSDNRNSTSIQDLTVLTNTTHITRNVHNRNEMVLDRAWHYWTEGLVQTKTDYYRRVSSNLESLFVTILSCKASSGHNLWGCNQIVITRGAHKHQE